MIRSLFFEAGLMTEVLPLSGETSTGKSLQLRCNVLYMQARGQWMTLEGG